MYKRNGRGEILKTIPIVLAEGSNKKEGRKECERLCGRRRARLRETWPCVGLSM